jgi:cytochrome c
MMMRIFLIALLLLAVNVAAAADGEKLYVKQACATCHGPTGNEPILPTYPKIGGQNRDYLVRQMNDIKSGARDNGASVAMRTLIADLGDADIEAIAKYLSDL